MGRIPDYSNVVPTDNDKVLGTDGDNSDATQNFTFPAMNTYFIGKKVTAPATAGATGTAGDYAVESGFAYFCVATNVWERVAIATW